jgi:hypothetical protein
MPSADHPLSSHSDNASVNPRSGRNTRYRTVIRLHHICSRRSLRDDGACSHSCTGALARWIIETSVPMSRLTLLHSAFTKLAAQSSN